MIVELETLSKSKYHPFWGDKIKITLETIYDQDTSIEEIKPDLKPENPMRVSKNKKMIYHSAVVGADMEEVSLGETSFVAWADERTCEGFVLCLRAKHMKVGRNQEGRDIFKLLFSKAIFGRFGEEKAWGFERGPFMKLEAFTYSDPFKTLYIKVEDDDRRVVYLQVDLEMKEDKTVLISSRVTEQEAPAHLVSAEFPA